MRPTTPPSMPLRRLPGVPESLHGRQGDRWRWEALSLGNGSCRSGYGAHIPVLYSTLGPIALLGIPGGLVRFDPTYGIIERAVVSRSGTEASQALAHARRAVMALMAEMTPFERARTKPRCIPGMRPAYAASPA